MPFGTLDKIWLSQCSETVNQQMLSKKLKIINKIDYIYDKEN